MGYYIEGLHPKHKARQLREKYNATLLKDPPGNLRDIRAEGRALVCVVDNGPFEAAGIAYNDRELARFQMRVPDDLRMRWWLTLPRSTVIELCPRVEEVLE